VSSAAKVRRSATLGAGVRPERVESLWERVDGNRVRAVAFTGTFVLVVSLLVSLLVCLALIVVMLCVAAEALRSGIAVHLSRAMPLVFGASVPLTLGWVVWRLTRSERALVRRFGAHIALPGELVATRSVLKDVTIAAGFRYSPPLYLIDVDKVNAFAIGRTHQQAVLGVTKGFVERIPLDEQRAVFANLMARIVTLDTLWDTVVSALMGPIWAMRDRDLRMDDGTWNPTRQRIDARQGASSGADRYAGWILLYGIAVVLTEVLSWWHQESAWMASEKADAEGMLLLKDPRAMLRALDRVLDSDNFVPGASDAYSQLFYCWAGFGFAPEDDPEYRRLSRLREVLGAEGVNCLPVDVVPVTSVAPVAPRLEID